CRPKAPPLRTAASRRRSGGCPGGGEAAGRRPRHDRSGEGKRSSVAKRRHMPALARHPLPDIHPARRAEPSLGTGGPNPTFPARPALLPSVTTCLLARPIPLPREGQAMAVDMPAEVTVTLEDTADDRVA